MATDQTVALTILQQMGGQRKLKAMIGAHYFSGDDNMLMFSFKGCRKANKCRVTLDYASDLYIFELFKFSPKKLDSTPVFKLEGVYFDMLKPIFEDETGLYLSL